jgi:hypothetical protein
MAVSAAGLRAESGRLRALGWSYRRIALEWQRRYHLNARVAFRLAHGWTQEEAARRWNIRWSGEGQPKTGKSFSYWEVWPGRGGRAPSSRTLTRLAELYLCRPGDLLDGEDFGRLDTGRDGGMDVCDGQVSGEQASIASVPCLAADAARIRQLVPGPREHGIGPTASTAGEAGPSAAGAGSGLFRHPV